MRIYQYNENGIYTGFSYERDTESLGIPFRYTDIPVPGHSESQFVVWSGTTWNVLDEDPYAQIKAEKSLEEKEIYLNLVRDLRMQLLNAMTGIALAAQLDGDAVIPAAFKVARIALLDLPQLPGVLNAKTKEETEAVIKTEYARIVSQTPAELKAAFKEIQP